jgi:hypothetical protein
MTLVRDVTTLVWRMIRLIVAGRWILLVFAAGLSLLTLAIQFSDSVAGDRAGWKLGLMLATQSVVVYLGYRRARTVQAVRARQGAVGARKGDRVAAAAAAAGAVGAAVAQAYAERASNVPVLVTLVWLGLGFMTGAFLFLVIHGDRTSVAAGRGTG